MSRRDEVVNGDSDELNSISDLGSWADNGFYVYVPDIFQGKLLLHFRKERTLT